jgi:hypothetical protein
MITLDVAFGDEFDSKATAQVTRKHITLKGPRRKLHDATSNVYDFRQDAERYNICDRPSTYERAALQRDDESTSDAGQYDSTAPRTIRFGCVTVVDRD